MSFCLNLQKNFFYSVIVIVYMNSRTSNLLFSLTWVLLYIGMFSFRSSFILVIFKYHLTLFSRTQCLPFLATNWNLGIHILPYDFYLGPFVEYFINNYPLGREVYSPRDRLTLNQSVLSGIIVYFLFVIRILLKVCNTLEKLVYFFMGSDGGRERFTFG